MIVCPYIPKRKTIIETLMVEEKSIKKPTQIKSVKDINVLKQIANDTISLKLKEDQKS